MTEGEKARIRAAALGERARIQRLLRPVFAAIKRDDLCQYELCRFCKPGKRVLAALERLPAWMKGASNGRGAAREVVGRKTQGRRRI